MRIFSIVGAVIAILAISCGSSVPLKVISSKNALCFDVQTLGEYLTPIYRIRLTQDVGGVVVWELKAKSVASTQRPQVWKFTLVTGPNAPRLKDVERGEFEVVSPQDGKAFLLLAGEHYTMELWGAPNSKPRHYRFQMPQ
jgi:hypothetical protein